jgi:hypothetical protein
MAATPAIQAIAAQEVHVTAGDASAGARGSVINCGRGNPIAGALTAATGGKETADSFRSRSSQAHVSNPLNTTASNARMAAP